VPVVFMIHGTSGSGEKFYNISGWREKADAEGFIAVFPSALSYCLGDDEDYDHVVEADEFKVTTKWAAGALGTASMPLCTDAQIAGLSATRQASIESRRVRDDVAFFDAILASIEAELPVDPRRLYVSGFSNGAQMSGRLLMERSSTFAAFAMAAGGPSVPGPAARPAPVVFSVGSMDDGFRTAIGVSELPLDASLASLAPLNALVGTVTSAVQLDPTRYTFATGPVRGKTVSTFTYSRSLIGAGNQLVVAVVEDATHQYSNGENHPVVMTDFLWPFFSQYVLP